MLAAGLHVAGDPIAPQHWRHVVYIVEEREQAERIVSGLVRYGGLGLDWATVRERLHIVEACRLPPDYVARGQIHPRGRRGGGAAAVRYRHDGRHAGPDSENDNSEGVAMAALKQGLMGCPFGWWGTCPKATWAAAKRKA